MSHPRHDPGRSGGPVRLTGHSRQPWLLSLPSLGWLSCFVLVPSLLLLVTAFRTTRPAGGVGDGWTWRQFSEFAQPGMGELLWRTLWVSALTTGICLLLALPVAWFLAHCGNRWRQRLLLLILLPFWTNFLIRVFAWNQILHSEGWLARSLRALGLLGDSGSLLFHPATVVLVSVYAYLPFAILPIYAAAQAFDFSLLDAARDLGATPLRAFRSVFLPGIRRGLTTAWIIVFIPMLGSYVVPDLVGGRDGPMIGNKIVQRHLADRNLPAAAAMATVLTLAVLVPLWLGRRPAVDCDASCRAAVPGFRHVRR